jgi:large subunit ribosomal protein L19e
MTLRTQRRLAAELLRAGENRIWIDPDAVDEVSEAVTRDDVRRLIKEGVIRARQKRGISSYRRRRLAEQKRKGRRKGHGSRKGSKYARYARKERWMTTIRALRRLLRELRDSGELSRSNYRRLYRMAKGGAFRSRAHLRSYIAEHGLSEKR